MVNEVVREERRILQDDTLNSEQLNTSITPMSSNAQLGDMLSPSSSFINLQYSPAKQAENQSVISPFNLPPVIPQQDDMEFEREEEQNEQVKQFPKYMDTILKLVSKIEASIKSGKIQTALDHTDQKIVQDYTFFIEQVCLMMLEGD